MRLFDPLLRLGGRLRLWQQFVLLGLFVVVVPITSTTLRFLSGGQQILTEHEIIDLSDESNLRVNEIREEFEYLTRDATREARALGQQLTGRPAGEERELTENALAGFAAAWSASIPQSGETPTSVRRVRRRYFDGALIHVLSVKIPHAPAGTGKGHGGQHHAAVSVVVGPDGRPVAAADPVAVRAIRDLAARTTRGGADAPTYISDLFLHLGETDSAPRCFVAVGWPYRWTEGHPTDLFAVVIDFTRYLENRARMAPRHHFIVTRPDGTILVHPVREYVERGAKIEEVTTWAFPDYAWTPSGESPDARQQRLARMLHDGGARLAGVPVPALQYEYRKGKFGDAIGAVLGQARVAEALREINQKLAAEAARDPGLRYGELSAFSTYAELSHPDRQRIEHVSDMIGAWWDASRHGGGTSVEWTNPLACKTMQGQLNYLRLDQNDQDEPPRLIVSAALEELHDDIDTQFARIVWTWVVPTVVIAAAFTLILVWALTHSLQNLAATAQTLSDPAAQVKVTAGGSVEVVQLAMSLGDMAGRLRGMNEDLDARVKMRTAELAEANTKLEVALGRAEAAGRAKDTFVANMSHELRQPLHIIIGFTEALREEAADAGRTDLVPDLNKILAAAKHLLDLINDILDMAKITSGRMELSVARFDLPRLVEDVRGLTVPLAGKNANGFEVDTPADLGTMTSDERRVRQILINLLSNAFKFTNQGRVTLRVRRVTELGRDWIEFTVTDSGKGMTDEQIARLFQRFYQADPSTTRGQGGTGLGLAISQSFNELLGGRPIEVTSTPDRGSSFIVRLPAELPPTAGPRGTATTLAIAAAPAPPSASPEVRGSDGTILVIDDDPVVQELMARFLGKEGFRVAAAATGADGLRFARELRPDAITLDVLMSGTDDGWTVLSRLKADPATSDIPIVMLTILDDRGRGFALGAADYLTKPIDWSRLGAIMRRYQPAPRGTPVLIVDDDPKCREMVTRFLTREGWRVTEAEDGAAGIRVATADPPALILLDLMMPRMDGFEFLDEFAHRFPDARTPVVILTAKDLTAADFDRLNGRVIRILEKGDLTRLDAIVELVRRRARPLAQAPDLEPATEGTAHADATGRG
ncbi:response regulator [Fimbriiglobus ruber]|uniref:histidine kinase n=1 Tax=Fimbriiglobus ruber TaxID=1908690 RepID=A0A225D3S9_9BACT|nr:response regulator [Fimbriiglobus ruber]OWK35613.1 Two-component system sensory histidine kinase [Fimbriiglobus ruber]